MNRIDPDKVEIVESRPIEGSDKVMYAFTVPEPEGGWSSPEVKWRWIKTFREKMEEQLGAGSLEVIEP